MIGEEDALLYINDLKFKKGITKENLKNGTYNINDLLEGELLDNFNKIKESTIKIIDFSKEIQKETNTKNKKYLELMNDVIGSADLEDGIMLNSYYINKNINNINLMSDIEKVLSHEVQHMIQEIENGENNGTIFFGIDPKTDKMFFVGENKKDSFYKYRNNPLEIESEVVRVMNAMTVEERKKYPLNFIYEQVKKHYESNDNLNPRKFIQNLEKFNEEDLKIWYNESKEGINNNDFKRYQYTNKQNIDRTKSEQTNKGTNFIDIVYENGERARINTTTFERESTNYSTRIGKNYRELENSSFNLPLSEQLENKEQKY